MLDADVLKKMIGLVAAEEFRRENQLNQMPVDVAYDHWLFTDMPFVNEMCLWLMVALHHQVERELMSLAVRAVDDCKEISYEKYSQELRNLRKPRSGCLSKMRTRLSLRQCTGYRQMETLRLVANCCKHSTAMQPDKELDRDLFTALQLETEHVYAALPESNAVRERLAKLVGLTKECSYSDIAVRFVDVASDHLKAVKKHNETKLSHVKRGPVPLNVFAR